MKTTQATEIRARREAEAETMLADYRARAAGTPNAEAGIRIAEETVTALLANDDRFFIETANLPIMRIMQMADAQRKTAARGK